MEFGKALTFPFEDDDWLTKLAIGAATSLLAGVLPIIGLAPLTGWRVRLIRNVKNGDERPLPAWDDFGDISIKGLQVIGAQIIYQLPLLLFVCAAGLALFIPSAGAAGLDNPEEAFAAMGTAVSVILACCGCLAVIYSVVAGITFMGGLLRFVDTDTFSTFMEFGTNFQLVRDNLGLFINAVLIIIVGGFVIFLVGGIASAITLGLGSLLLPVIMNYFSGHILGQLGTQLAMGGGEPAPAAV